MVAAFTSAAAQPSRSGDKPSDDAKTQKTWPQYVASFMLNELRAGLRRRGLSIDEVILNPDDLGALLRLNYDGHIDRKTARASFENMLDRAHEAKLFLDWAQGRLE